MVRDRDVQIDRGTNFPYRILAILAIMVLLSSRSLVAQQQLHMFDPQTYPQTPPSGPVYPSDSSGQTAPGVTDDDGWHFALSPYLWFGGSHGTVGALGRTASVHASPW